MNRSDLGNGINGREALNADERKVADLLRALPRAEAPSNFEFGVKARISAGVASRPGQLFRLLKVAAPLTLVLLVAGIVMFYGVLPGDGTAPIASDLTRSDDTKVSQPATKTEPLPTAVEAAPATEPAAAGVAASPAEAATIRRAPRPANRKESGTEGGYKQLTHRQANIITPPGIPATVGPNANTAGREIPVKEVFEILGVNAEFVKGAWTVRSCAHNSICSRVGLKADDAIEAIDERQISRETKFRGTVETKSVRVRRDGKPLTIHLQKK